jgi:uncharacterized protein DUF6713
MKELAFYLGLGAFFTHELDAMPNHEWRGLPLVGALPDEISMAVFVALHVPLFAVVVALLASPNARTRDVSRVGVTGFIVIHGVLHVLSMGDPAYEFSSFMSNTLIFGGAALGAVYLVLELRSRHTRVT